MLIIAASKLPLCGSVLLLLMLGSVPLAAQELNWVLKSPASSPPAPRLYSAMAYDAAHGQVVLFGGYSCTLVCGPANDTWVWDGTNWTQKSPANSPPVRAYHTMAYDAARARVTLFGGNQGFDGNSFLNLSDT